MSEHLTKQEIAEIAYFVGQVDFVLAPGMADGLVDPEAQNRMREIRQELVVKLGLAGINVSAIRANSQLLSGTD